MIELNNFFLGVGGVLTFKNSELKEIISKIDMNHLILETDAPYLTPTPFRGKEMRANILLILLKNSQRIRGSAK